MDGGIPRNMQRKMSEMSDFIIIPTTLHMSL